MFKKFKIKTFGCQMNIYDSQKISDIFYKIGFKNTLSDEDADIYVINTCHIRNKAKQKLYSELGKIYKIKKNRYENKKKTILIVAGCVAQAEGKEIFKRAPYVDIIVGSQSYQKIPKLLKKINKKAEEKVFVELDFEPKSKFDELPKDKFTNEISSYLTIQEGCNKFCKFCVVPYTRGPEYSRSVEEIVDEAKSLVKLAKKEFSIEYLFKTLIKQYNSSFIITGGDSESKYSTDYVYIKNKVIKLKSLKRKSSSTHGTGCVFSTALTIFLARGYDLLESTKKSKKFIERRIKISPKLDTKYGPLL